MELNKMLLEYATLKETKKALEEKEATMKEEILKAFNKQKIDKMETDYGIFTKSTRVSYTYTDKVKTMEEKVKLAKLKEVEQGKAVAKESSFIVFNTNSHE